MIQSPSFKAISGALSISEREAEQIREAKRRLREQAKEAPAPQPKFSPLQERHIQKRLDLAPGLRQLRFTASAEENLFIRHYLNNLTVPQIAIGMNLSERETHCILTRVQRRAKRLDVSKRPMIPPRQRIIDYYEQVKPYLTPFECRVAELYRDGYQPHEIADMLNVEKWYAVGAQQKISKMTRQYELTKTVTPLAHREKPKAYSQDEKQQQYDLLDSVKPELSSTAYNIFRLYVSGVRTKDIAKRFDKTVDAITLSLLRTRTLIKAKNEKKTIPNHTLNDEKDVE